MTLCNVSMSVDVMAVCLQHALSTEFEEIMGLLIGEVDEVTKSMSIATSMTLIRSDKKPDRVEISEEQLVNASIYAEQLSQTARRPLRVIGWYHSHPHITVWPSSVDLRTQAMYQSMDSNFVGIIFSVFVKNNINESNEIEVTCFQSVSQYRYERKNIPLKIVPSNPKYFPLYLKSIIDIHSVFVNEEKESHEKNSADSDENDILWNIYNNCTERIAFVKIAKKVTQPTYNTLYMKNRCTDIKRQTLTDYRDYLLSKLKSIEHSA